MRFSPLLGAVAIVGCTSPASVLAPTRTPRARTLAVGAGLEAPIPGPDVTTTPTADPVTPVWLPRPRAWVAYAPVERLALSFATVLAGPIASAQLGVQYNPIRTRFFDVSFLGRGGLEWCLEPADLFRANTFCRRSHGPTRSERYGHASAVLLVGVNPSRWLTLQAQGGIWGAFGAESKVGPWLGGNALFLLGDHVALGPDVAVLPGWFPDGRALVQPSLSLVYWPKGANPYRDQ